MKYNILIGGFGGQGVMMIGQILGYAACEAGKNATFLPSYGPEQRGGTANCSVVISDETIGAPNVSQADVLIAFNMVSLLKFLPGVRQGGVAFINCADGEEIPKSDKVEIIPVQVDKWALEMGSEKVANIIMLGALIQKTGMLEMDQVEKTVLKKLAKKPHLLELNKAALRRGADSVSV